MVNVENVSSHYAAKYSSVSTLLQTPHRRLPHYITEPEPNNCSASVHLQMRSW